MLISSTELTLIEELNHIKHVFISLNDYPERMISHLIESEVNKSNVDQMMIESDDDRIEICSLTLPYGGSKGENIVSKLKRTLNMQFKKYPRNETKNKI